MNKAFLSLFFLCFFSTYCLASNKENTTRRHPVYIGIFGGYGATTWEGLVPPEKKKNEAISMTTPISTDEGGNAWGFMAGYEFVPYLAAELNYTRFPDASVCFDSASLFSFMHDGKSDFRTRTESISVMGKVMMVIPETHFRIFSSAGFADLHRKDLLLNDWRLSPSFGGGVNYRFSNRLMAEFNGNYTAGFGESQLNPTESYYPFLYSITLRLAYFL